MNRQACVARAFDRPGLLFRSEPHVAAHGRVTGLPVGLFRPLDRDASAVFHAAVVGYAGVFGDHGTAFGEELGVVVLQVVPGIGDVDEAYIFGVVCFATRLGRLVVGFLVELIAAVFEG